MKTMQLNWKRSLATLALLTAFNPHAPAAAAPAGGTPAAPATPTPPVDAVVAEAKPSTGAVRPDAGFEARYGPSVRASTLAAASSRPKETEGRSLIEAKLKQLVLPEVRFDGLPLTEVVRYVSEQCLKLDPEKRGVNFIVNNNVPEVHASGTPGIDPTTGMPITSAAEPVDMSGVLIRFDLPLRNLSVLDLLDAMVKVADHPIEYSIEEYGVVLSPKPGAPAVMSPTPVNAPEAPLRAQVFKIDTNTLFAGLNSAFGIRLRSSKTDDSKDRSNNIQAALHDLLNQLGIAMSGNKSIFYNDLTGMLMFKATPEDLEVMGAAIRTLGGDVPGSGADAGGGGGGTSRPAR